MFWLDLDFPIDLRELVTVVVPGGPIGPGIPGVPVCLMKGELADVGGRDYAIMTGGGYRGEHFTLDINTTTLHR